MRIIDRLFRLAPLLVLVGCAATDYEKMNVWNGMGYEDKEIEKDTYWVIYHVNGLTAPEVALKFWHQRARELCGNRVYEHDAKVVIVRKSSYNPGTYSYQDHYFPHVEGTVRCKGAAQ